MQRGFAPILILVGILVILGVISGAYYVGILKNNPKIQNPIVVSQTPTPVVSVQPTSTPDETANWKTYTNTKYGYSSKYPKNWSLKEENEINRILIESLEGISDSATSNPTADEESNGFLWIETMDNKSNVSLKSWFDNNETCGTIETGCASNSPKFSQSTTVNEKEAIIADWELPGPLGQGIKVYYFINGKNIYRFSFFYPTNMKNQNVFSNTYNQILSTFKFLDQNSTSP